ncbi:5'-3' exonuclease [Natronoglycomyces albus]|uniref:5'-3' exonuclease n=1 Tax=Natronoglycomyces albus TaxID=2811108 RepID=UPI001FE78532|nr:5'-3' exonuclease [Natronoglycomyces albus]
MDAASLWYRSYHAIPSSVTAPNGKRSGAIRGFFDGLSFLTGQFDATGMVCCLEGNWRPQWRLDLLPGYKVNRTLADGSEDTPEGLDEQVAAIEELLVALGIATASHPDFEADDVIATLVQRSEGPAAIVTGDRDLFQLVDDERDISVIYMGGGLAKSKRWDAAAVMEKYGVRPDQYRDFAVLRGDASDGLPGVKGIGEKGAATLLHAYGDLDDLVMIAHDAESTIPKRQRTALLEAEHYLAKAASVSTAITSVDIPDIDPTLPREPVEADQVESLVKEWGLANVIERLTTTMAKVRP